MAASIQQQPGEALSLSTQADTYGLIRNGATASQLQLTNDSMDWSGSVTIPYPIIIPAGQSGNFVQEGPLPVGSKGGVVYSDGVGNKWLVAYHTPANKVYVEVGKTISSWDEVRVNLDNSGDTGKAEDTQSGGKADASITSAGKLVATFSI